jgi:hypothetical protein
MGSETAKHGRIRPKSFASQVQPRGPDVRRSRRSALPFCSSGNSYRGDTSADVPPPLSCRAR